MDNKVRNTLFYGSHDSAAYTLRFDKYRQLPTRNKLLSKLTKIKHIQKTIESITITQNKDIRDQLLSTPTNSPVKAVFLDLRVLSIDNEFWFGHTIPCIPIGEATEQITSVLAEQPDLFIVIRIKHDYQNRKTMTVDRWFDLSEYLRINFASYLGRPIVYDANVTWRELHNDNRRVLFLGPDEKIDRAIAIPGKMWVEHYNATIDVKEREEHLKEEELETEHDKQIQILSKALTPGVFAIIRESITPRCLPRKSALQRLAHKADKIPDPIEPMIVMYDFV